MTKDLLEYIFLLYNSKTFVKILAVPNSVVFFSKTEMLILLSDFSSHLSKFVVARPYYPHNRYHLHSSHVPVGLHP